MKKKFLSFLSLVFVLISCIILFSACGAPSETGFKIILNGKEVNSQTIELSYGEEIDLEVFSTFNDNTTKEVPESKFTLTDPNNIIGLTPSVGTYELKVKYANYDEVDISIIVVPKEIDMPTIGASIQYSGEEQSCLFVGFDSETMNVQHNTATAVGNYTAVVSLKDTINYVWKHDGSNVELYYNWGIVKKRIEKPYVTNGLEYNGNEQDAPIIGLDTSIMDIMGDETGLNAGNYFISISLKEPDSYCWEDATVATISLGWEIEKVYLAVPTLVDKTYTFNTTEQSLEFVDFDADTMRVIGDKQTYAFDAYVATLSIIDKDNYCWMDGSIADITYNWAIEKKAIYAPVSVGETYVYDGTSKTLALNGFDDNAMTIEGNEQIQAGEYTANITLKDSNNYCWADSETFVVRISWVISKASVIAPSVLELSGIYDPNKTLADYDLPENYQWIDTTIVPTVAVSSYQAKYNPDSANYNDATLSVTINIAPAVLISVTAIEKTYTYTGEYQTFELVGFDETKMDVSGNQQKDAGNYVVTIKITNDNYSFEENKTQIELNWKINKAKLAKPVALEKTYTYTGEEQTFELVGFDADKMSITSNKQTNAGEYIVAVTLKINYCWEDESVTAETFAWTINKAKLAKPVALEKTYTYTGEQQTFELVGFNANFMTVMGNKSKNAGRHSVIVSLSSLRNCEWDDGTTDGVEFDWVIGKYLFKQDDKNFVRIKNNDNCFEWTGSKITPEFENFDDSIMKKTGDVSATEIKQDEWGNVEYYYITIEITDKQNYAFANCEGYEFQGEYAYKAVFEWRIDKKEQTGGQLKYEISKEYDGTHIREPILTGLKENPLIKYCSIRKYANDGVTYTDDFYESYTDIWQVGKYNIWIEVGETQHYYCHYGFSADFYISYDITKEGTIFFGYNEGTYTYNGSEIKANPSFYIYQENNEGNIFGKVNDFALLKVAYENNVGVTRNAKVIVTGDGNLYKGTVELEFEILPSAYLIKYLSFEGSEWDMDYGYYDVTPNPNAENPYLVEFTPIDTFGELNGQFFYSSQNANENIITQITEIQKDASGKYSFVVSDDFCNINIYYYENGCFVWQNASLYNATAIRNGDYVEMDFMYSIVMRNDDGVFGECEVIYFENNTATISKGGDMLNLEMMRNSSSDKPLTKLKFNGIELDYESIVERYGHFDKYIIDNLEVGKYEFTFGPISFPDRQIIFTIIVTE